MSHKRNIETGSYQHIYSRGVNRCLIFNEHSDYLRFQNIIKKFNTTEKLKIKDTPKNRGAKQLVDIFCYTLMPNHFHFILKELISGGTSLFFQKILPSYANYFNKKYGRVGALFGQRFKNKLVNTDNYFEHLVGYIWNNPIKLINPEYSSRDLFNGKIKLSSKEKFFAQNYQYKVFPSNYLGPDYKNQGKTNFDNFDF